MYMDILPLVALSVIQASCMVPSLEHDRSKDGPQLRDNTAWGGYLGMNEVKKAS
jgi:hypothetical protein